MLRERGLGNRLLAHLHKGGAILRTIRAGDLQENGNAHRIGERVQNGFDGYIVD